jgi:hypothetical protein
MTLLSFANRAGYDGVREDMFNAGPDGVGMVLKPEIQEEIQDWAKSVANKKVDLLQQSYTPKAEKPEVERTTVSEMTTEPDYMGENSGISKRTVLYQPGKNPPKRTLEITEGTLVNKLSPKEGDKPRKLSTGGKVGERILDIQKAPMGVTWIDGSGYFQYSGPKFTYYVPLSQQSFNNFLENTGKSAEEVREKLVKVAKGDDLSMMGKFSQFLGEEYNKGVATDVEVEETPESTPVGASGITWK